VAAAGVVGTAVGAGAGAGAGAGVEGAAAVGDSPAVETVFGVVATVEACRGFFRADMDAMGSSSLLLLLVTLWPSNPEDCCGCSSLYFAQPLATAFLRTFFGPDSTLFLFLLFGFVMLVVGRLVAEKHLREILERRSDRSIDRFAIKCNGARDLHTLVQNVAFGCMVFIQKNAGFFSNPALA
jgi:hypothetical protein